MPRILLFCAVLTVAAGRVSAGDGADALAGGIRACRAGKIDSAIVLLAHKTDNPYLEAFRLYWRSDCFVRDSMYRDARAEIDTLFALASAGAIDRRHGVIGRARNLYIEALARDGSDSASCALAAALPESGEPSAPAAFLVSLACLDAGDTAAAVRLLASGARARPASADTALFKDLIRRYEALFPKIPTVTLAIVARSAAGLHLAHEAHSITAYLAAERPDDFEALLCRADVLALTGASQPALHLYWRVFSAPAPVKLKMACLYGAASIELRLKRYDKAARHFRMYATFYPKSETAPSALDTAARIYVIERQWNEALSVWTTLRRRYPDDPSWTEAGLSEAALRSWLGRKREARNIVRNLLPRTRRTERAAALYWMMRTSSSDSAGAAWSDSLERDCPRSFYAMVARNAGDSVLSARNTGAERRRMGALAECADRRRARLDTVRADSTFEGLPVFEAYRTFLEAGLGEEADMTARALVSIPDMIAAPRGGGRADANGSARKTDPVRSRLLRLYAGAATHGRDALSLFLLTLAAPGDTSRIFPWELAYPLPHAVDIARVTESLDVSPLVVFALIREESRFDSKAVSVDGARGLMQLLPATASWIASETDSSRLFPDDLFDPQRNIGIGIKYFSYLLARSKGSLVGALACYNGGEGKMAAWAETFRPAADPLTAIEMIGPRETRRYVKKVLESLSAYRAMAEEGVNAP
jgi:soluble lytic murein transglycosylase